MVYRYMIELLYYYLMRDEVWKSIVGDLKVENLQTII